MEKLIITKNIDKNFVEVINILNQKKIQYWICHGTLLGIIREGKLIEWDHDVDIAVWNDDISKDSIINLMKEKSFNLRDGFGVKDDLVSFDKQGGRTIDFSFMRKKKKDNNEVAYVTYFIPRNFLMKIVDALSSADKYSGKYKGIINSLSPLKFFFNKLKKIMIKINLFYKGYSLYVPTRLLKETKTVEIENLKIKIPLLFKEYLEFVYGQDWIKPKKDYIWPRDYKTF